MYCSDVNMATLKAGGAGATVQQSTKLMLPHEMLSSSGVSHQSMMHHPGGHSAALLLNPSSAFFTNTNHHLHHTPTNNHHHTSSNFQSSFSSFAATATTTTDYRAPVTTATSTTMSMQHNHNTASAATATTTTATAAASATSSVVATTTIESEVTESKDSDDVIDGEGSVENVEKVEEPQEEEPEIDIVISNVVCSFSVRCHLNLRHIALEGFNVEFRRENGMVTMKLRRPYTTASIWSSGRITCTGATSEDQARIAARKYARCLQKLGFRVRFHNFRIVNVLGTCSMPWAIKITQFSERYRKEASYEPELHPGVTYKLKEPKATLKIFSTGSITVTAASVAFVQQAIEHIFPLVYEFRKKRSPEEEKIIRNHAHAQPHAVAAAASASAAATVDVDDVASAGDPFNADDLIEVDEDFVEGDDIEPDDDLVTTSLTAAPSSSSVVTSTKRPLSLTRRGDGPAFKRKRRRPAGKAVNDPDHDIMQVSDVEGYELSDDDL